MRLHRSLQCLRLPAHRRRGSAVGLLAPDLPGLLPSSSGRASSLRRSQLRRALSDQPQPRPVLGGKSAPKIESLPGKAEPPRPSRQWIGSFSDLSLVPRAELAFTQYPKHTGAPHTAAATARTHNSLPPAAGPLKIVGVSPANAGHRVTLGGLLGANVAVFLGWAVAGLENNGLVGTAQEDGVAGDSPVMVFMRRWFLYDNRWLQEGRWWLVVTPSFSHQTLQHLAGNMVIMLYLGKRLHEFLGRRRLLALYLLGAASGTLATELWPGYSEDTIAATSMRCAACASQQASVECWPSDFSSPSNKQASDGGCDQVLKHPGRSAGRPDRLTRGFGRGDGLHRSLLPDLPQASGPHGCTGCSGCWGVLGAGGGARAEAGRRHLLDDDGHRCGCVAGARLQESPSVKADGWLDHDQDLSGCRGQLLLDSNVLLSALGPATLLPQ